MAATKHDNQDQILTSTLLAVLLTTAVVAVCYFARDVLLPLALATLLSFLLAPLARRFQRWGLGRAGSVVVVVVLAFGALATVSWAITRQILDLANNISQYEERLTERIQALRPSRHSALSEVAETVEHLEEELAKTDPADDSREENSPGDPAGSASSSGSSGGRSDQGDRVPAEGDLAESIGASLREAFTARPLPVQVVDTTFAPVKLLRDSSPVLSSISSLAITIVFVIFMLLQRDDLRDRLIRLAGTRRVYMTTQALDDAARRVSRYLLMQLIVNGIYGLAVAVGLWLIGLPNAPLWGALSMLLRFVPYVGPIVGCVTPIALSLAVFPGWARPLETAGLFIGLELITNNILEPWLYGSSTGVSTLGIIVAAVFWTWLWGPVGLVLATPLTVCITVLAQHVPQFAFLSILLADEPPLEAPVRFYQRLLAADFDDAVEIVTTYLRQNTRADMCDDVLVPALNLAERDRDAGYLSEARETFVYESISEVIEDLDEIAAPPVGTDAPTEVPANGAVGASRGYVLCVATDDEADLVAAKLLSTLLADAGRSTFVSHAPPAGEKVDCGIPDEQISCIVISTIAPSRGALRARRVCFNLRRRYPHVKLITGIWNVSGLAVRQRERMKRAGADAVSTSLHETISQIDEWFPLCVLAGREGTDSSDECGSAAADSGARLPLTA